MKTEKLKLAIAEAERFINCANKLIESKKVQNEYEYGGIIHKYDSICPKESGATRRASMDLTRTLAELRKAS